MTPALVACVLVLSAGALAGKAAAVDARRRTLQRLVSPSGPEVPSHDAPRAFVVALRRAGVDRPSPAQLWRTWTVGGACVLLAAVVLAGLGLALALGFGLSVGPPLVLWSMKSRGNDRYEAAVPALLDDVASGLRAGASLVAALGAAASRLAGQVGADVTAVVDAVEHGGSFVDELDRWVARRQLGAVRLAGAALAVGATTGGRQAQALEAVSVTLRERADVRGEAIGLAAQSRSAAAVMAVLPVVFAVFAGSFDQGMGHLLLHTPIGLACLVAGLALDVAAGLWMSRITRSVR